MKLVVNTNSHFSCSAENDQSPFSKIGGYIMVKFIRFHWKKEFLSDKCSLDKLAEAPGSRQLDVGQTKNYHHSQEKEIEHCPLTNSKIKMDFCCIVQSVAKCFTDNHSKKPQLCRCPTFPDLFNKHHNDFIDICTY